MARVPGILGLDEFTGQDFPSRGLGSHFALDDFAFGRGPIGWQRACAFAIGRTAVANREHEAAEKELDVLRRLYGPMFDSSKKQKAYFTFDKKTKKWVYDTAGYTLDRSAFFGSTEEYESYRAKAKEELDADKEALRRVIEPQVQIRKKHADWKDAQDAFYAWTKKAFDKQVLADDPKATPDFTVVIKAQMSETLKTKLATVKLGYKTKFKAGGFNPRPQKVSEGYRLGTLSEHAVGNAIDIEDAKNPQIEAWRWTHILAYTGKTWNDAALSVKWKSKDSATAKSVYDDLKAISDEWASKIAKAVKASEEAAKKKAEEEAKKKEAAAKKAAAAAKAAPATAPVDHLAGVIAADEHLKKIGAVWVRKWKDGFLNLEWDLVKELHSNGFKWGALFSNPDIHHFEL